MTFLLGSTWLALNIWATAHGTVLAAAVLCAVQPVAAAGARRMQEAAGQ